MYKSFKLEFTGDNAKWYISFLGQPVNELGTHIPRMNGPVLKPATNPAFMSSFNQSFGKTRPRVTPTTIPTVRDKVKFEMKKPTLQLDKSSSSNSNSFGVKVFPSAPRSNSDTLLQTKGTTTLEQKLSITSLGQKPSTTGLGPKPSTTGLVSKPSTTGLGPKSASSSLSHSNSITPTEKSSSNPRIVLQIKNNQVLYNSVVDSKKPSCSNSNGASSQAATPLVPYNDEGSSDSDQDAAAKSKGKVSPVGKNEKEKEEYPPKVNGSHSPKRKEKIAEPVLDEKLNATMTVPGSYTSLGKDFLSRSTTVNGNGTYRKLPSSPVKKSFSDTSPLNVNVSSAHGTKVNATSLWHVMDQDAMVSPSLASGSSSASFSSTTDWQISNKSEKRPQPLVPEAQSYGWTITPTKGEKPVNGNSSPGEGEKKSAGELQIRLTRTACSGSDSDKSTEAVDVGNRNGQLHTPSKAELSSSSSSCSALKDETKNTDDHDNTTTTFCFPKLRTSKPFTGNGTGSTEQSSHKKHKKKHKKHKHKDRKRECDSEAGDSHKRHKHKKKHKHHRKEDGDSSDEDRYICLFEKLGGIGGSGAINHPISMMC